MRRGALAPREIPRAAGKSAALRDDARDRFCGIYLVSAQHEPSPGVIPTGAGVQAEGGIWRGASRALYLSALWPDIEHGHESEQK